MSNQRRSSLKTESIASVFPSIILPRRSTASSSEEKKRNACERINFDFDWKVKFVRYTIDYGLTHVSNQRRSSLKTLSFTLKKNGSIASVFPSIILPRRSTASSSENNFFYRSYKSLMREILRWSLDQLISQLRRKKRKRNASAKESVSILTGRSQICSVYSKNHKTFAGWCLIWYMSRTIPKQSVPGGGN